MNENQRRKLLWLVRTTEQVVELIEELTGETVTPEEIEQLRQAFGDGEQDSSHGTRH